MSVLGIPPKLINLCRMTNSYTRARAKAANDTSEVFTTRKLVKQGDVLSCDLFNLSLEFVIRRARIETEGTIFNISLGFADDIDLGSREFKILAEALKKLVSL